MKLKNLMPVIANNQSIKIRENMIDTNLLFKGDYELEQYLEKTVSKIFTDKQDLDVLKIWVYEK
jgi:beta-lactamase superfamily II metal-dependent hydrolase